MHKFFKKSLLSLTLFSVFSIQAAPVAPTELNQETLHQVLGTKASDIMNKYNLYFDSEDQKLIWFVAKTGSAKPNQKSTRNRSVFRIISKSLKQNSLEKKLLPNHKGIHSRGYFHSTNDTGANQSALNDLYAAATTAGFTVQPAIAKSSKLTFVLFGKDVDRDGYPDVDCELKQEISSSLTYPQCTYIVDGEVLNVPEAVPVLDINSRFNLKDNITNNWVRFTFQTVSSQESIELFRDSLLKTKSLDALLYADMESELQSSAQTEQARFKVNLTQANKAAYEYAEAHNFVCKDSDLNALAEKIIINKWVDIDVYNQTSQKWETIDFDNTDQDTLTEAVEKIKAEFISGLFQPIQTREDKKHSVFVFKKNIDLWWHLQFYQNVSWSPKTTSVKASTHYVIDLITDHVTTLRLK
tara:strand:- start:831 stop:2066 length:1236 start_codon:yes stop_codon:yes gene_type:complete